MGLEISAQEILIDGLHVVRQVRRDVGLRYRKHILGEIEQGKALLRGEQGDGGGTVSAADVQNSAEFALAEKMLDRLGADIDVEAPAFQIRLRRFKQGFYFVELGAQDFSRVWREADSNPERRIRWEQIRRAGNPAHAVRSS